MKNTDIVKNENFVYEIHESSGVEFLAITTCGNASETLYYLPLTGGFYERMKDVQHQIIINVFMSDQQNAKDDSVSE